MSKRDSDVIGTERTCDGCAERHPVAAVVDDAYACAACVLTSVAELHSKRTGTNDFMAPYTYDYCVEAWRRGRQRDRSRETARDQGRRRCGI